MAAGVLVCRLCGQLVGWGGQGWEDATPSRSRGSAKGAQQSSVCRRGIACWRGCQTQSEGVPSACRATTSPVSLAAKVVMKDQAIAVTPI